MAPIGVECSLKKEANTVFKPCKGDLFSIRHIKLIIILSIQKCFTIDKYSIEITLSIKRGATKKPTKLAGLIFDIDFEEIIPESSVCA
jgi:hypothetical protein